MVVSYYKEYHDLIVTMLAQGYTTMAIAERIGSRSDYQGLKSYIYQHDLKSIRQNARHGLHYKEYFNNARMDKS